MNSELMNDKKTLRKLSKAFKSAANQLDTMASMDSEDKMLKEFRKFEVLLKKIDDAFTK